MEMIYVLLSLFSLALESALCVWGGCYPVVLTYSVLCVNLHWVVGFWHGYLSGARCRFAYGPADATATQHLLLQ